MPIHLLLCHGRTVLGGAWPVIRFGVCILVGAVMLASCASLPKHVQRPASYALAQPGSTPLGRLVSQRRPKAVPPNLSGFALLASPNAAFAARLALTQRANKTLDIQYYSIHVDRTVASLLRAVRAAAQRGVRVRILLDDFNSTGRGAQVMGMANVPGVEMRMFNPLPGDRDLGFLRTLLSLDDFQRIQHRMHNKLYVADNAWGIVGGRNLGDAYFGTADGRNFIDMDVLAAGPVVQSLSASFDRYWNSPLAYPVASLIAPAKLKRLHEAAKPLAGDSVAASDSADQPVPASALDLARQPLTWASAGLLVDSPLKLVPESDNAQVEGVVIDGLMSLLHTARHDVIIVSPYFVPGAQMMALFADLRKRGVRVRVLTNSLASTDSLLAQIGYARHRERLLRMGVELYEMRARERARLRDTVLGSGSAGSHTSLHAKLVIVDGRIISIGSMNLDLRSKLQNTEVALVIRSPKLAHEAAEQVQAVIKVAAWKVGLSSDGEIYWHALLGTHAVETLDEPDTSVWLRLLAKLLAPLTPDEML
ncbi:MAG: phospholipase D family protein [Burkholderiaceae bacterium]|nr:MAG: phospholipase D family protein [Burkholderiaceae bacterium]TAM03918.1 MAG: phospholipase D family protein [Pusillimonas sp.]